MPEFKYDYGTDLETVLQDMGMKKTFSMTADFSGMGEPSVMVDRVIHKTHIELDRNGTKAAAATAVIAKEGSVYIDDPFTGTGIEYCEEEYVMELDKELMRIISKAFQVIRRTYDVDIISKENKKRT